MQKILVPTDFSDNAKQALQLAADIAVKHNAALEVLHVNTAAAYAPIMPELYTAQLAQLNEYELSAANDLKNLKRDVLDKDAYQGLSVETRIEAGLLYSSLRKFAEEDGCDLVVMGTKGASNATEFFVGSNTERVIRTAICPVLAIPFGTQSFNPQTVVLTTTLRPDQAVAFNTLAAWQNNYGFKVKVLYLNNPGHFETDNDIESALQNFCKASGLKDTELFVSADTFNEEQAILQFAATAEADMIAMATHQRKGISHLFFGSLTEDTANHSDIPVLCIPIYD